MSLPASEHFSPAEFACKDGTPYPENWAIRLARLMATLETIRTAIDCPIHILSGYRTPAHNANVQGAQFSQHMYGRAADITAPPHQTTEIHAIILKLFNDGKLPDLGGLGLYPTWVHVDIRDRVNNHLAQWTGP